jgi:hypothetical protein
MTSLARLLFAASYILLAAAVTVLERSRPRPTWQPPPRVERVDERWN